MKKKKNIKQPEKLKYYIDSSFVNLNNKDYLENYIYSDELSNKIDNYFNSDCEKPLYIGVIGSWGSGKTSIVETSLNKLDKKTIIYRYDAWKYEGDSFRRNFIQNILNQSVKKYNMKTDNDVYKKTIESLYEDYSISSNSIMKRIELSKEKDKNLSIIRLIICTVVFAILLFLGIYNILNNLVVTGDIIALLGAIGIFNIFYSTTVYSKSKMFSSEQFYKSFTDILIEVKGNKNIILIDNLDRCSEKELKETMSIIKGFYVDNDESKFKNEKIIFIIPLDINSLEKAYENDKNYYLDKIFDDMIYIKQKYNTDKLDFINKILNEYPEINMLVSSESKSIIINSIINTPREIIKILNDYVTEYNILLNKNGDKFVQNQENRNYLMKTVILKRLYYDFYQLAYTNIEEFMNISNMAPVIPEEEQKGYNNVKELFSFLSINASIKPTNFYEFFQSQDIKSYNNIPESIKKAIMERKTESIIEYTDKNKIVEYYINIFNDLDNGFWNPNILNKYIVLIELYKNKYFNDEQFNQIIASWKKVFNNEEFNNLNINNVNLIGFENELIFSKDILKDSNFNILMIEWINNNKYKFENENIKYESLSKWIIKNDDIILEVKFSELLNSFCEYTLNNNLFETQEYLEVLFGKNIKLIKREIIKEFISKNTNNEIILKILNNLIKEEIIDEQISNELNNWINNNEINNVKLLISILDYMIKNNRDISIINTKNIKISESINNEDIENIMNKYFERNIYNDVFFSLIRKFNNEDEINFIISRLTNDIPNNNEEYINGLKKYFFDLPIEIKKYNLKSLNKIINRYKGHEENILSRIIEDNILRDFYETITIPEDRESIVEKSIKLISNDFNKQLNNIFIYESSNERMNLLISNHKSIHDYVQIINKMSKANMKKRIVNELIEIISEKDNIVADEISDLETLETDKNSKEKIRNILNSKEENNKELVNSN